MEKLINFTSTANSGPFKNVVGKTNMGYYSEEDISKESTPENKEETKTNNNTVLTTSKLSNIKLRGGYETEDSDDSLTPDKKSLTSDSKTAKGMSSFFVYKGSQTAKQHQGDEDEAECEEFTPIDKTEGNFSQQQPKEEKKQPVSNEQAKQLYDNEIKLQEIKILKEQKKKQKKIEELKEASQNDFKEDPKKVPNKNKALHKFQTEKSGNDTDCEVKKIQEKKELVDALKHHPWRHLIFGHQINEDTFKKHLILTYRGLVYAKKCLKGPSDKFIKTKQVIVPDSKYPKNRTLLLDLDETLIHSCGLKEGPDHVVWAKGDFGEESKIGFKVRPYCHEFLQKLSQLWDIYVFTASSASYASAIINFLDPEAKYIIGILNRANCMETKNGFFIKDLRILKNKSLKSTIIVDNLAHSFGFQIDNGIPILEWHNDKADAELKYILSYLVECAQAEDVRKFNKERLKLQELTEAKLEDIQ